MKKLTDLLNKYKNLNLLDAIDYEKFNQYLITNHSTSIEGSTLTKIETDLLLDEGLTPKGKPLEHSLMTKDHHKALLHILNLARNGTFIDLSELKRISSELMLNTGSIYKTALGTIDATKGDLRKMKVQVGESSFPNFNKVPELTEKFCQVLNQKMKECSNDSEEQLKLSFAAHYNLVTIHPFCDGNGRISRLIMNYVQESFKLPLSIVFKEDKMEYYKAIISSREQNQISPFHNFMFSQYEKQLKQEIKKQTSNSKGLSFLF